jgi:hypothetical protein
MKNGPVIGLAALVLGVVIAQVALAGGTSTDRDIASLQRDNESLHRQIGELKSQFAATAAKKKRGKGKRGPPGPQGPQGIQGAQGLIGPTFADVEGTTPPFLTPELIALTNNVSIPAGGRLLVMFSADAFSVDCPTDNNPSLGLYIDGTAIFGTGRSLVDEVSKEIDVFGLTGPVGAGAHQVQVAAGCSGAESPIDAGVKVSSSFGAVLVGS